FYEAMAEMDLREGLAGVDVPVVVVPAPATPSSPTRTADASPRRSTAPASKPCVTPATCSRSRRPRCSPTCSRTWQARGRRRLAGPSTPDVEQVPVPGEPAALPPEEIETAVRRYLGRVAARYVPLVIVLVVLALVGA